MNSAKTMTIALRFTQQADTPISKAGGFYTATSQSHPGKRGEGRTKQAAIKALRRAIKAA